jgi:uncharacterized NAD-dependent epimerase/dehydratase family protein
MSRSSGFDGNAIVYCDNAFNTPYGKTAHGLVRFTDRYRVVAVIDHLWAGRDAGEVLDRKASGIPVCADLSQALKAAEELGFRSTHFVIGLAPDGGSLSREARTAVLEAVHSGLNVDSGLHHFLSDDPEIAAAAKAAGLVLRDIRKTPDRRALHPFTGRIAEVESYRIALLGTDSAVGKRTTAWKLKSALDQGGISTAFIGTGQTAWLQGARFCMVMDSMINDFVAGEIEHAILSAWDAEKPAAMVIEGQGSLMNPIYPGGFEILAAGLPHAVVLQHAPARVDYDGLPGYRLHSLEKQIRAIEMLSEKPVVAITVNHEELEPEEVPQLCRRIEEETGLPTVDPLLQSMEPLVDLFRQKIGNRRRP